MPHACIAIFCFLHDDDGDDGDDNDDDDECNDLMMRMIQPIMITIEKT